MDTKLQSQIIFLVSLHYSIQYYKFNHEYKIMNPDWLNVNSLKPSSFLKIGSEEWHCLIDAIDAASKPSGYAFRIPSLMELYCHHHNCH